MKIHLIAIGNMKASPEKTLVGLYQKRLLWPFSIQETVCKKPLQGEQLKVAEEGLLSVLLPSEAPYICLDERGKDLTSVEFAMLIKQYQDQGEKHLSFVIGGADGLSEGMRRGASNLLSFGRLTWPHMMVRVLLMEQLYRAQQILAGHPYHRE